MNRKLFYGALAICAALALYFVIAANNPTTRTDPLAQLPKQQQLLERIATEYGYKSQSIEWKCQPSGSGSIRCGSALTLPDAAWNSLPEEDRQLLIEYAQTQGKTAIVIGKVKDPSTISLDREVWTKVD